MLVRPSTPQAQATSSGKTSTITEHTLVLNLSSQRTPATSEQFHSQRSRAQQLSLRHSTSSGQWHLVPARRKLANSCACATALFRSQTTHRKGGKIPIPMQPNALTPSGIAARAVHELQALRCAKNDGERVQGLEIYTRPMLFSSHSTMYLQLSAVCATEAKDVRGS